MASVAEKAAATILIQHIVLRKDLAAVLGWPLGSVIAQACHASVAALAQHSTEKVVATYLEDVESMRKVVVEINDETALLKLSDKLNEAKIKHTLWREQPENIITCLATIPTDKTKIHKVITLHNLVPQ